MGGRGLVAPGIRPRAAGWDRLRRDRTSYGASFSVTMIALGNAHCKCLMFRMKAVTKPAKTPAEITNSLNALTITPNFGQSLVTLAWDKATVASRPGPVRAPDSSAPQPPGSHPAGPSQVE